MAKMQEQLKNLPPEARAQMEALMKGRGGMPGMPGAAPKTEFRQTGSDQVGGWPCVRYDGLQNNQKVTELCTVEPQALGFTQADLAVSRELLEFFRGLMPQNADNLFVIGSPEQQGFSGVPVRPVAMGGPQQTVTELVEVSRQTFEDSLFAVPEGFARRAMPFGAPQGR